MAPGLIGLERERGLADQGIDVARARLHHPHEAAPEEQQHQDAADAERQPLEPRGNEEARETRQAHEDRADAEEDQIEPARRGELQRRQRETEQNPQPPCH